MVLRHPLCSYGAGSAPTGRGVEFSLEDLKITVQLNSLQDAAELCEAMGLEVAASGDNTHVALLPRVILAHTPLCTVLRMSTFL
jgi:hypothetical protein